MPPHDELQYKKSTQAEAWKMYASSCWLYFFEGHKHQTKKAQ